MVLRSLGEIGAEGIRGLARNLFPGFYERGLTANDALQELRSAGLGYRRQDFLNDFRTGESRYSQEIKIRFTGEDTVPSEGVLQSKYHGVPDKYSLVFKATGTDPNTGEDTEQYFYMHRNSLDTRSNMESEAEDWLTSNADHYSIDIESIRVVEGYINPAWA